MRRNFTSTFSWIIIIALAVSLNCAYAATIRLPKHDTISYYLLKRKPKKSPLNFTLPPIKPGVISSTKLVIPNDKLLSNVEVYPNPIVDQINLKYVLSRNSNVTIKMVDVLGNDVMVLFSQRVEPGEQVLNRQISNKLNRGFYFIRVIAGTESVIKRISLL
ncbi:T9SS type A sorting domain-containing protein [Mucilaginibacter sp. UR6-11]|uniref:T9SS type A sorting domain-containing protein n=1 Tax=Mucilaginibacter sp. UR6-11 TaxID=1435644 RepID=UPI001E5FDF3A|nr:T9SS type A sorting domain-containing protein [Mucilaginibacter sp. UR6-11]MCC8423918.1 T9SS type A sorting domain-containing protein [Mucilaginibacter sp. UR6-11]